MIAPIAQVCKHTNLTVINLTKAIPGFGQYNTTLVGESGVGGVGGAIGSAAAANSAAGGGAGAYAYGASGAGGSGVIYVWEYS